MLGNSKDEGVQLFRHIGLAATLAAACSLVVADARAATATSNFVVTGNVVANCTISTTGITVTYDPAGANAAAGANATASGTVTIACTKGSTVSIGLNAGGNAAAAAGLTPAAPRGMRLAATANFLGYDIYWPGTTTSWGNSGAALFTPSAPTSKAPRTFNMDGVVFGGQDVPVGTYTDTVTATVNF